MKLCKLSHLVIATALALGSGLVLAHGHHHGGIATKPNTAVKAPFDIIHTKITTEGNVATFHMAVSGKAGASKPAKSGKLAGSTVFSYVWPTTLDTALVGFEPKAGILAFAVTSHPDFDDTPLFDENGDSNTKMMALCGIRTGSSCSQMKLAAKVHSRSWIFPKIPSPSYPRLGQACPF